MYCIKCHQFKFYYESHTVHHQIWTRDSSCIAILNCIKNTIWSSVYNTWFLRDVFTISCLIVTNLGVSCTEGFLSTSKLVMEISHNTKVIAFSIKPIQKPGNYFRQERSLVATHVQLEIRKIWWHTLSCCWLCNWGIQYPIALVQCRELWGLVVVHLL